MLIICKQFNSSICILLSIHLFIYAFITSGTDEERGIKKWRQVIDEVAADGDAESMESGANAGSLKPKHDDRFKIYDLPLVTPFFRRQTWTRYVPFCPSFDPTCGRGSKKQKEAEDDAEAVEVKYNGQEEVAIVVGSYKNDNAHNNTHLRKTVGGDGERDGNFNTPM